MPNHMEEEVKEDYDSGNHPFNEDNYNLMRSSVASEMPINPQNIQKIQYSEEEEENDADIEQFSNMKLDNIRVGN